MKEIIVRGARSHNLKNININIPRDKLVVITGLSGSGKSSFAFDTLYSEGQRRYVESLSTYARQFLSMAQKPDVDLIEGLSPAISIEQKATSHNPRSTVGTITEIYDYLRLLFARVGDAKCPEHKTILKAMSPAQMAEQILKLKDDTKIMLLSPIVQGKKGENSNLFADLKRQGFMRLRIDGVVHEINLLPKINPKKKHDIDIVIDRIKIKDDIKQRLVDSIETALKQSDGLLKMHNLDTKEEELFSANLACPKCSYCAPKLEPKLFSFNNPYGACSECSGLGIRQYFDRRKIIVDDNLSLSKGALKFWDKRNLYYYSQLESLAKHYNFSLETPFKKLPLYIQEYILTGSTDEIEFTYINNKGYKRQTKNKFEGILNNFQRRYKETESKTMLEEFAKFISHKKCDVCRGQRLNLEALNVFVKQHNISDIVSFSIKTALDYFQKLSLDEQKQTIGEKILKEIKSRLEFLVNVGLDYLTLSRQAETLSGGEAQRIRLASQIGAGLVGVMYVLDEPSIGLHQKDNQRLINTLTYLRDLGNSVIVVEHDEDAIHAADFIIDIGPKAGVHGGEIVATGKLEQIKNAKKSLTGKYLSRKLTIDFPLKKIDENAKYLEIKGASGNNLKRVTLKIPIGYFSCVTGVSGSGKSTLINDTLYKIAKEKLNHAQNETIAPFISSHGFSSFDKVVDIDQSPIGRTPRSNPATYTGLFTHIREIFGKTTEAKIRGYQIGRFSFNVKGGRCEACRGDGLIKVEMHFLADIYVTCKTCDGKRYNAQTLEVKYKNKNIHEVLDLTIDDAFDFFNAIPSIKTKLQTLIDVGLGYIKLGQAATTLSGGEAQRVKLAKELSKRDTGKTLYILDEPTTGLHFHDVNQLLKVLHRLRDKNNTVIVIEHNLDVIKTADWIVDLGPKGGDEGGQIIATGTPKQICANKKSATGEYLKIHMQN